MGGWVGLGWFLGGLLGGLGFGGEVGGFGLQVGCVTFDEMRL